MTIDEALANAARVLKDAETAPPPISEILNKIAASWLAMADLMLTRERSV